MAKSLVNHPLNLSVKIDPEDIQKQIQNAINAVSHNLKLTIDANTRSSGANGRNTLIYPGLDEHNPGDPYTPNDFIAENIKNTQARMIAATKAAEALNAALKRQND